MSRDGIIRANHRKVVRVTPTISAAAYSANDVLFLTTEIPNAVTEAGGCSKLLAVTMVHQHDAADDVGLVFMENSVNLISSLSPGSSGGSAISDSDLESANLLGFVQLDSTDNRADLGGSGIYTTGGNANSVGLISPILLQAASGSTSVYVAGIALDAQDYEATDDLDLIFHIEY